MIFRKLSIVLLFFPLAAFTQADEKMELINRMLKANEHLVTAKFTLFTEERLIDGKFFKTERLTKLHAKPKKIYFYSITPNPGTEILWKEGWMDEKMLVSPKSFPFITFSLKTTSSIARKDSHHSLEDIGFEYMSSLIVYYRDHYGDRFYDFVSILDTVSWDNHQCIRVSFDFREYAVINYTVKKDENVITIAKNNYLNDYSILMLNSEIDDYEDVEAGQVIKIPNSYCRKLEFFIDMRTWLPLKQLIYDTKGLYERYEMKSFILNPSFSEAEFTPDYKDYKF